MAERRMFSKTIVDSDAFLDMPVSTQCLYFHLSMRADDEGFVNNPKRIQRMVGMSDDDMRILIAKQFIIPFESGICVIKHWFIHNYIRNDRFKSTSCIEEKSQLALDDNKIYYLGDGIPLGIPDDIPNAYQMETQVRLGKDSIDKEREKATKVAKLSPPKLTFGEFQNINLTLEELDKLKSRWSAEQVESMIENLSSYLVNNTKKKYKNHYAVLLTWLKKDFPESKQADEKTNKTTLIEEKWCYG